MATSCQSNLRLLLVINEIKCKYGNNCQHEVLLGIILRWVELCVDIIPRVLETLLRDTHFSACLVG